MKIISVRGTVIRIHYLFGALMICLGLCGQLAQAVMIFGCVLFHEFCHIGVARWLGYHVTEIALLPFGGRVKIDGLQSSDMRELAIVLAGPVGSALCAVVCRWGPAEELTMAQMMAETNMMLALWNMIPAYPLDGGRVVRILFGYMMTQKEAVKRTADISYVVAAVLLFYAGYEWIMYHEIGVSFLIMAVMIVRLSAEERRYWSLMPFYTMSENQRAIAKEGYAPIVWYAVRYDVRVGEVIALFRPQTYTMIRVILRSGEVYGVLSETMISKGLESHLLSESIGNFCNGKE